MSVVSTGDAAGGPPFDGRLVALEPDVPATLPQGGWRRLVEWSGTSAPVAALLLAGMALGPRGISLLSADTLLLLAPAIPVAVGGLGVLLALSVGLGKADDGRIVLPACLEALLTVIVVTVAMAVVAHPALGWPPPPLLALIAGAGICAASSLTLPTGNPLEPRRTAVRLVEVGALVPVLLGGAVLAGLQARSPLAAAASMAAAVALICALALAAWLLLTQASNETEERVLTVSALLVVGGVAEALSTSALLGGVVAGWLWRYAGQRPHRSIGRDVQFVQHLLVVGLLLTAGASAELSRTTLLYAAAYVACRVVARLASSAAARAVPATAAPADLGTYLLHPGILGVAFALNATGVLGRDASVLLGTVVLGTIGSELVAYVLSTRRAGG